MKPIAYRGISYKLWVFLFFSVLFLVISYIFGAFRRNVQTKDRHQFASFGISPKDRYVAAHRVINSELTRIV